MGFKEHLFAGLVGASLTFTIASSFDIPGFTLMLSCFVFLISSVFPDIDHHRSIPRRYFRIFIIVLLSLITFHLASNFINQPKFLLLALLFPVVSYYLIDSLIPKHRGIMHTYGFLIVYTLTLGFLLESLKFGPRELVTIMGNASLGYLTHLILDGIELF